VKLLFDENLSHRLVGALADAYSGSEHVRNVGLKQSPDTGVSDDARRHGFMIVSKDADFHHRSLLMGFPPKIVWLRLGNCSTKAVEKILRDHVVEVQQFEADPTRPFLSSRNPLQKTSSQAL
jgi:predicted nuclease of predicted toxin-antitoxin system